MAASKTLRRKPQKKDRPNSEVLYLRVTPKEKELLTEAATLDRLPVTVWAARFLLRMAETAVEDSKVRRVRRAKRAA